MFFFSVVVNSLLTDTYSWSLPFYIPFNTLSPNINMHLLHTFLHTLLMILLEKICSNITTFHLW